LFPIDKAEIVRHAPDDPDAFLDLFDAKYLTDQDVGDAEALAVHAQACAGGDEDVSIVQTWRYGPHNGRDDSVFALMLSFVLGSYKPIGVFFVSPLPSWRQNYHPQ